MSSSLVAIAIFTVFGSILPRNLVYVEDLGSAYEKQNLTGAHLPMPRKRRTQVVF
jgi:hypothetical protein